MKYYGAPQAASAGPFVNFLSDILPAIITYYTII